MFIRSTCFCGRKSRTVPSYSAKGLEPVEDRLGVVEHRRGRVEGDAGRTARSAGSYQPFSSWKSATNMWSVKMVPKPSSLSRGFGFFWVARVIRIGWVIVVLADANVGPAFSWTGPRSGQEPV